MTTTLHCPPERVPSDEDLAVLGARFLGALLDSADASALGRSYWTRARSALEAAACALGLGEAVSRAAAKLQIDWTLSPPTIAEVAALRAELDDPAAFAAWAEVMRRDAVYVTALARIARDERRAARAGDTAAQAGEDGPDDDHAE